MMSARRSLILAHAVWLAACVPRLIGLDDDGGDDDSSSSTSSADGTDASTGTSGTVTTDDPTDDSTSTGTDTDNVFVPERDYANPNTCDPFAQDCPEGEKCVPYASSGGNWDANKCVAVMGQQAPGESCWYGGVAEATDNCDATSFCWDVMDVDGELLGTCRAFCMGTPDNPSCPEGFVCSISSDGSITQCIPTCDPLAQDCDAGLGCYWAGNGFNCVFRTEDLPTGSPCGYINDCAPGNICVDGNTLPDCMAAACCTSFCNIELGPGQCDALPGTECVSFWELGLAPPGRAHIGICLLMP